MSKRKTVTLGVDSSTTATGWAVIGKGGVIIDSGVVKIPDTDYFKRALATAEVIAEVYDEHRPVCIWMEDQFIGVNRDTSIKLVRTGGVIAGFLYAAAPDAPLPVFIKPSAWRKKVGIKAKTEKQAKMDALHYWKGQVLDHNIAEAALIGTAAYRDLTGVTS